MIQVCSQASGALAGSAGPSADHLGVEQNCRRTPGACPWTAASVGGLLAPGSVFRHAAGKRAHGAGGGEQLADLSVSVQSVGIPVAGDFKQHSLTEISYTIYAINSISRWTREKVLPGLFFYNH